MHIKDESEEEKSVIGEMGPGMPGPDSALPHFICKLAQFCDKLRLASRHSLAAWNRLT